MLEPASVMVYATSLTVSPILWYTARVALSLGWRDVSVALSPSARVTVRSVTSFTPVLRTVNWMGVRLSAVRFP